MEVTLRVARRGWLGLEVGRGLGGVRLLFLGRLALCPRLLAGPLGNELDVVEAVEFLGGHARAPNRRWRDSYSSSELLNASLVKSGQSSSRKTNSE